MQNITPSHISLLEQDPAIINKYLKNGALVKNPKAYIPIMLAMLLINFLIVMAISHRLASLGSTIVALIIIGIILSIAAVVYLLKLGSKKLRENTAIAPICLAKPIAGNIKSSFYYCIYTTGSERHNPDFINSVAQKISQITHNPDNAADKAIARMFNVKLIRPNDAARQLPLHFTNNIPVWRRQFKLNILPPHIRQQVEADNSTFYVAAPVPEVAAICNEAYQQA